MSPRSSTTSARCWVFYSTTSESSAILSSSSRSIRRAVSGEKGPVRSLFTLADDSSVPSCGEYVANYLAEHTGYLTNPASTSTCDFCRASTGDDYLQTLNISYGDRWQSLGILAAYTVSNLVIAYALVFFPPRLPGFLTFKKRGSKLTAEEVASAEYERELAEYMFDNTAVGRI